MSPRHFRKNCRRNIEAGLTLVELLVVLVVLTALGGLIVPAISSSLTRAHESTGSANFALVHDMVQRAMLGHRDVNGSLRRDFGNHFETGCNTAGASVNGYVTSNLTQSEVDALAAAGIETVVNHDPGAPNYHITFQIGATPETITTNTEFILIEQDQVHGLHLATAAGERYVLLMIGRDWTPLLAMAQEPPTLFRETSEQSPRDVHCRFGLIFQVADDDGPLPKARFKTVAIGLDGTSFETQSDHSNAS